MRAVAACLLAVFILTTGASTGHTQSTSNPAICLKTCIETYGSDKRQACALKCGYGSDVTGGQGRDCGTIYKQCLAQCRGDNACRNDCRRQRTQCF